MSKTKNYLLFLAVAILIILSAYYYSAFQIPSQARALEIRGTVEALRRGN